MRILRDWKSFFSFLAAPAYTDSSLTLKDKSLLTLNLFILKLLIVIAMLVASHFLFGQPGATQMKDDRAMYSVVGIVLFAGIFEELVFRLFLTRFHLLYICTFLTGFTFIAIKKFYFHTMLLNPEGLLISSGIAILLSPIFYYTIKKNEAVLSEFWQKHFSFVFYFSAILFACSHFFNNTTLQLSDLKSNIPLLFSAVIFGFIRIRAGLIFAIILHIVWDLMVI